MRYPLVLFYRPESSSEVDTFIKENADKFHCSFDITGDPSDVRKMVSENYHLLMTYGDDYQGCVNAITPHLMHRFYTRWVHKKSIADISQFSYNVTYCYIDNCIGDRVSMRAQFSVFTTCYNSYNKIVRAYDGVKSQTLKDWEWVIVDDSPDDKHFEYLRTLFKGDMRVRLYRRAENSGNIGNVKNEAISLCRGKYLIELDHDDIILPDCLMDAFREFEADSEVGFIYMNFANIGEDYGNFTYGDFICAGYGGYVTEKYNGKWFNVYLTPNINNVTLSSLPSLPCCPNHPRIWRKKTLEELGNFCELLPICDDYEILLRTCTSTKVVKINKLAYLQFMNNGGSNFSLIRSGEINRIGPHYIYTQFYQKHDVNGRMKELDAYEDTLFIYQHSQIWKRKDGYEHKFMNRIVNKDHTKQVCLIGTDLIDDPEIRELYNRPKTGFVLLDNKHTTEELWGIVEARSFDRMLCYSLKCSTDLELERYFLLLCKDVDDYIVKRRPEV